MAIGYYAHGKCWPDQNSATAAHWSAGPGLFITPGATTYMSNVVNEGGWFIIRYSISSSGVSTKLGYTALPLQSFPYCDTTTEFMDGMTLGWGVAAAIVAAWAVKNLRRGL